MERSLAEDTDEHHITAKWTTDAVHEVSDPRSGENHTFLLTWLTQSNYLDMPCKYEVGQKVKVANNVETVYVIISMTQRPPCHYDLRDENDPNVTLEEVPEVQLSIA